MSESRGESPTTGAAPSDDDRRSQLHLALTPGIGPRLLQNLLDCFGSPQRVLAAPISDLRGVPGIGPKLAEQIAKSLTEISVDHELAYCQEQGITLVFRGDADYPKLLAEIPDPPPVLFVRGALAPQDGLSVAVVGTRHATPYGLRVAERLGGSLARAGFTVVSGLARGIDAKAHRAALAAGGRTLAVLGGGIDDIYPPEHAELANDVAAAGALISEAPPRRPPLKGSFPQRNRIISGISLGVLVVEAGNGSGALITARHATEQNREVFAVPGPVDSRNSFGCHRLIRDGARLVETVDDVLEQFGPLVEGVHAPDGREVRHPAELQLNDAERQVLDAIPSQPTQIDEVVARCGLPVPCVLATLSALEMRRLVRRISGSLVARA